MPKPRSKKSQQNAQKAFETWVVQFKPQSSGDLGYPFRISTSYGPLLIGFDVADTRTYKLFPGRTRFDWLYCKFERVDLAHHNVSGMNPFTGKWNHEIPLDKTHEALTAITGMMQLQGITTIGV